MSILSFKPYLLLVFPMSVSVTSQHSAADERHLGAIHSTTSPSTVLYSHSCPRQYHFHARVQMRFSKFKYGLALCLKYFSDFGLLLVNYLMQALVIWSSYLFNLIFPTLVFFQKEINYLKLLTLWGHLRVCSFCLEYLPLPLSLF